jgi:hypothetical protein
MVGSEGGANIWFEGISPVNGFIPLKIDVASENQDVMQAIELE